VTALLIDLACRLIAATLCLAVLAGWWWEVHGRRAWMRELGRREAARIREWRDRGRPLG
jgi:hypothetical protein